MAGELIWSRAALDDIEAIAAFLARDSAIQARRLVEQVFQGAERRLIRPTVDQRRVLGQGEGMREYGVQGLRVLYEPQGDDVHILGVVIGTCAVEA
ncbi:type II toxin-antitoxin system RelE/ParE family toxin [Allochromatium palmeri]|uniref:Type II toxin-antitoxin system RelE/ParE family toxin n=1 Tax=Allochromatium palmeri TaxID=231048 RepID=A0A6N8EAV3_9GAMM|nr:type II toxin-antitoxin system RelE/ParE family toxin [Allochromatium palmeri]MTW20590.1 type II toxin-antitoxin system RelE/ParE family toxin [Allochromatium palmeri]